MKKTMLLLMIAVVLGGCNHYSINPIDEPTRQSASLVVDDLRAALLFVENPEVEAYLLEALRAAEITECALGEAEHRLRPLDESNKAVINEIVQLERMNP